LDSIAQAGDRLCPGGSPVGPPKPLVFRRFELPGTIPLDAREPLPIWTASGGLKTKMACGTAFFE